MAILSRPRLISQERLDLEDIETLLSSARTDSKLWTKQFLSGENHIVKGFTVTGVGLNVATIVMSQATLIHAENTSDFSYFIAEPAAVNITITDADLTDNARNFIELKLGTESNTPLTKAFWDPGANGGLGAEFNQQINTVTDLCVSYESSTGGFSGLPDRLPLAIIDTDGAGVIKVILDRRNLFFRLGTPANIDNDYSWTSRESASHTLVMTGVTGSFTDGEIITIDGSITAEVISGGTTTITFKTPSAISFSTGDTVVGGSGNGTVDSIYESFNGADKDVDDFKELIQSVQTEIKAIKGTRFWFNTPSASIEGLSRHLNSMLVQESTGARFLWSGSALSITDDNGAPADADLLAGLQIFGDSRVIEMTRQDGTGGSSVISLSDGQVIYIELPTSGTRTFTGAGALNTNYQVISSDDFIKSDDNFWLAYRKGTKLYLRGLGELEAGEAREVNDESPEALKNFLGFDPETATSIPYTAVPNIDLPQQYTTASTFTESTSVNCANINNIYDILDANSYEETLLVVSGAPGAGELGPAPIIASTVIGIPLDSRDGSSVESYVVGKGGLEVFLNGRYLTRDVDWQEVGVLGAISSDIRILKQLEEDDELTIRHDVAGGFLSSGAANSLQAAYNLGRTITVTSGQPIEISGPASEKLLIINGDIDVTGVIDPKGITFTRGASNPLPAGQDGIWNNTAGELQIHQDGVGSINLTQIASGSGSAAKVESIFSNTSGSTIAATFPVRVDVAGELQVIDVSDEAQIDALVGLTDAAILTANTGVVATAGRITNITTAFAFGDAVYLDKTTGGLTNIKPEVGVNSFISGDFAVRLGVIVKNNTNPLQKDLVIRIGEPKEL